MTACKSGGKRARGAALLLACLAIPFSISSTASAQDWPARTVTFVVPLGAGSASDIMARVVADQMGRQLNRTFVVENRPGAGGTIGAAAVARAAPDGYTVLAYGALATANALYSKLAYDTLNDFVPVIAFGIQPLVIVSAPEKGYKTLADLIAAGKAKPGSLNYSSAGAGSASHFAGERLRVSAGIQAQHVTYKGAAEAVTEVVAGRIDFSPQLPTTTLPLINDGKLVALAVSAQRRIATLPNVPTTVEAGLSAEFDLSVLQRPVPAREDAARHRRPDARRSRQGDQSAGGAGAVCQARRRAAADGGGRIRQVFPRRRRIRAGAGAGRQYSTAIAGTHDHTARGAACAPCVRTARPWLRRARALIRRIFFCTHSFLRLQRLY